MRRSSKSILDAQEEVHCSAMPFHAKGLLALLETLFEGYGLQCTAFSIGVAQKTPRAEGHHRDAVDNAFLNSSLRPSGNKEDEATGCRIL